MDKRYILSSPITKQKRSFLVLVLFFAVFVCMPGYSASAAAKAGQTSIVLNKTTFSTKEDIVIGWKTATNATKYGLSVWKSPYNYNKPIFDNYVTGTSKNIGKLSAGTYRIQMATYNGSAFGSVTGFKNFTVKAPVTTSASKLPATSYPWNVSNCPMVGYLSTGGSDGNGGDGHGYGCRQCASYVAWKISKVTGVYASLGNAKDFVKNIRSGKYGLKDVGDGKPHAGSVGIMTPSSAGNPYGHVVWVESEANNGKIWVSQYNKDCGKGYGNYCKELVSVSKFADFALPKKK